MKNVFLVPSKHDFDGLFLQGHARGGGLDDIRRFLPPSQRGRRGGGIFTALGGLVKRAIPFIMRTIAPEAVRMGKEVLHDVMEGGRLRGSLKTRGLQAMKGIGQRVARGGGRKKVSKKRGKKKEKVG